MVKYIKVKHAEKACSFCGNLYEPKTSRSTYCSDRCKDNASKIRRGIAPTKVQTKICVGCGKEFETQYKRKLYCKKGCKPYVERQRKQPQKIKRKKIKNYQYEMRSCEVCGQIYQCIANATNKTCSNNCSDILKKKNRRQYQRNRDHRIKEVLIDKDINLDALRLRDKDICWICGTIVNDTDYKLIDGHFIAGNNYPSIDHTHPLALGGVHSWENVRLAHKGCNQQRGASMSEVVDERTKAELRLYARQICSNKKEVIQYVNGVEYCRYESTKSAAELNGVKDKTIQNAARLDRLHGNSFCVPPIICAC